MFPCISTVVTILLVAFLLWFAPKVIERWTTLMLGFDAILHPEKLQQHDSPSPDVHRLRNPRS